MSFVRTISVFGVVVTMLWLIIPACSPESPANAGKEGGPCYTNSTCDQGLTCTANICKAESTSKDASTTPETNTTSEESVSKPEPTVTPDTATPTPDTTTPKPDEPTTPETTTPGPEPKPEPVVDEPLEKFSFFVTSMAAMQKLSKSKDGFGGNLGGLTGADKICQTIAAGVGFGSKTWRAFLSVTKGPDGKPIHAIERIGKGPWYDRNGRLIANNVQDLLNDRPKGDPQAVEDLTNEHGQGQHQFGDNHDTMTGSSKLGKLNSTDPTTTCDDWTTAKGPGYTDKVMCGHSWPRGFGSGRPARNGANWMSDHKLRGCAAGINLKDDGRGSGDCVGCSGGYGGIYCFALTP